MSPVPKVPQAKTLPVLPKAKTPQPHRGPLWALWYGGNGYAPPDLALDLEYFPSLAAAVAVFNRRTDNTARPYTPGVKRAAPEDGGPEMHLFHADPSNADDPYPDRVLCYNPRGGLVNAPA